MTSAPVQSRTIATTRGAKIAQRRGGVALDQAAHALAQPRVECHRDRQRKNDAIAPELGQYSHVLMQREPVIGDIGRNEAIVLKPGVDNRSCRSVGACESARVADAVTGECRIRLRRTEADRLHATVGKALQLVGFALAVAAQVAPQAQVSESVIGCVNRAVSVGVQGGELGETVDRPVSEELRDVVDAAVAVAVEGEQGIVRFQPTRVLRKAVGVQVEQGPRIGKRDEFNSVTVEVQHQRRDGRIVVVPERGDMR